MKLSQTVKRDMKLSLKTIRFEFPRFICFFAVLFLLQGLFCSILTLYVNNDRTQLSFLESEYRTESGSLYHLKLMGCNDTQRSILHNIDMDQDEDKRIFTLLGADVTQSTDGSRRQYDLYIRFEEDVEESWEMFRARYRTALAEQGPYSEAPTLLLSYKIEQAAGRAVLILQLTLVVALGALAVWVLHTIMTNHYKFTYGVYMSFGANFWRLFRTSIWEMVWAALFTWVPAIGVANLICWLLFKRSGLGFSVSVGVCLLTLVISLLTVGISVFASIKAVSRKAPVRHLVADDNSNLIRSPRHSASLIGATFPGTIGRLSFRRFGKYSLRLLSTALAFAMLFVGIATLGACYRRMLEADEPLFRVDFALPTYLFPSDEEDGTEDGEEENNSPEDGTDPADPDTPESTDAPETEETEDPKEEIVIDYSQYGYTDAFSQLFREIPHLGTVLKESKLPARGIHSHVRLYEANMKLGAGGVSLRQNGTDWRYQMNVNYQSLDEEIIRAFAYLGYGIEGSLEAVLTEPNTVAVTDSFLGAQRFDWEIGDVIYIATLDGSYDAARLVAQSTMYVTDEDHILLEYLNQCNYRYKAYTVGAILSDLPAERSWSVFFSPAGYKDATGMEPLYECAQIYGKKGITETEEAEMKEWLRKTALLNDTMSVVDLQTRLSLQMDANKNYAGVFMLFAAVLLLVSVTVWVISQILFYYKRRGEFELYLAVGAPLSGIRRLIFQDALLYAGVAAGLFALLAPVVSWLIHRGIGYVTVLIGGDMLPSFELPLAVYFIGMAVTAVAAWISTVIPYFTYRRAGSPLQGAPANTVPQEENAHE